MGDLMIYILVGVVFLVVGFIIGTLLTKNNAERTKAALEERLKYLDETINRNEQTHNELRKVNDALTNEKHQIDLVLNEKISTIRNLNEKLESQEKDLAKLQEKFTKDFEILANKILEEKSSKFTEQNKESLKNILNPLQEKIKTFEKKVEETNKESIDRHAVLRQQILGLRELNEQMSKDATNLTNALKGESKTQGDWGETQLEVLLEKAGLLKEVHYTTQGGYRDEDGSLKKPDFIINLPDKKHLIIDAKVSLTGYEAYYNAESEEEKGLALKKHLTSIKNHFRELGDKRYTDLYGINTPDYVLMFVPIEPALMVALSEDSKLYLDALDKNVVLVSNSTLLATLSTISSIWKQEDQKKNVLEIARQAGALYDKFEGFIKDLTGVGKKLDEAKKDYSAAMNKLVDGRGNLVISVEKLKKMGAKAKKSLPQNIIERASEDI